MSFADMMTLLFCLFMVLFSISSVNTSKFEELQQSLKDAFSGAVLDGGKSMLNSGSEEHEDQAVRGRAAAALDAPADRRSTTRAPRTPPRRPRRPSRRSRTSARSSAGWTTSPRRPACTGKVNVTVRRRGLVIQLLTDKVFFASGEAHLQARGASRSSPRSARSSATSAAHPVVVEGYTDSQPISNCASSPTGTCRARAPRRSSTISRRSACWPAGCPCRATAARSRSPATPRPKAVQKNRRVEIVLSRLHNQHTDTESTP